VLMGRAQIEFYAKRLSGWSENKSGDRLYRRGWLSRSSVLS